MEPRDSEPVAAPPPVPAPYERFAADYADFFRRELRPLVALATAIAGVDRGEEIAQEALLRAHRDWHRIGRHDRPGTWVRRLTIDLATSSPRRWRAGRRALPQGATRRQLDALAPEVDEFWALVRRLSDRQAAAVVLLYVDDLGVAEIADVLKCPESRARVHLQHGRQALAGHLRQGVRKGVTEPVDPDVRLVHDAASVAGRMLRRTVARAVDPAAALVALPVAPARPARTRVLTVAAVAVLLVGSVAVLGDDGNGQDVRTRLDLDADGNPLPAPQPGALTLLDPSDGAGTASLPVTIAPADGLADGAAVTVTGTGFVPSEQVGIVQCARGTSDGSRTTRDGIERCDLAGVAYAVADPSGAATGSFSVRRELTTPATGTIDCASEAGLCVVAMGALNDNDRSGGAGFTIGGGETIEVPTLDLSPSDGLEDGDLVRVTGEGFEPGSTLSAVVCATDPAACWITGMEIEVGGGDDGGGDDGLFGFGVDDAGGTYLGLQADQDGRVSGEVPAWRFLPGPVPGTYVDCAVSECSLRLTTEGARAPVPTRLGFLSGGEPPVPPAVEVDRVSKLTPGASVVIRGAGFADEVPFAVSLCVVEADQPEELVTCGSGEDFQDRRTDDEGTFAIEFDVPDPERLQEGFASPPPAASTGDTATTPSALSCDGGEYVCSIVVEAFTEGTQLRPSFPATPVVVTFRASG